MDDPRVRLGRIMATAISMRGMVKLGGVGAIMLLTGGCNKDLNAENRMAWASNDRGGAVIDVTRRMDGNRLDTAVVRSGPGFQYPQIASLRTGTQVTVIDNARNSNGNWSRVSFANGEGWIHQDILLKSREFQGKDPSSFAGYYETNYGQCTLQTSGSQVVGSCSDSTSLRCNVQGITLFCGWSTARSGRQGQARLSKHTDGSLVGTWGYNGDNINGGTWKFSRR